MPKLSANILCLMIGLLPDSLMAGENKPVLSNISTSKELMEKSAIKKASVQETAEAIKNSKVAFIDVREPDEISVVAAKGARPFPMSTLDPSTFEEVSGVKKSQDLYIICRSGARSMRVATALSEAGYEHLYNVEGGTMAWEQAGLPLAK